MSYAVALLRGINVGGRNKVAMQDLRGMFASLGYEDVRTYVQSGNVVFKAPSEDPADTAAKSEAAIAKAFDLDLNVVVRTGEELAQVAHAHPLAAPDTEPSKLHVVFLRDVPAADRIAALDPDRSPPDTFEVRGREVYVVYPNGAARSKLTADYFERTLRTPATARNWNTVSKLLTMTTAG